LSICDLKSYDTSVPLDFVDLVFLCFLLFGGERHKSEAKLHI